LQASDVFEASLEPMTATCECIYPTPQRQQPRLCFRGVIWKVSKRLPHVLTAFSGTRFPTRKRK
jgi:hypothetical protein